MKTKPVVFLSHSGEREFLQSLAAYLSDCEPIISDWADRSGDPLAEKVRSDVARADLVVILLTETALASAWVHQEIGLAVGLGKRVLPIRSLDAAPGAALPGLLEGREWEPYDPAAIAESTLRTAVRIGQVLQQDLVKVFATYWEYRDWWVTIDERHYTEEKCYWATPHDTWSWLMSHVDNELKEVRYRTLIRGDLEFDRVTMELYDPAAEVVVGVKELSALEEVAVIGNLSVETLWEPDFMAEVEEFLQSMPEGHQVISWYRQASERPTRIEVRLSMDPSRAASHRRRMDTLYRRYERASPNPPDRAAG